MMHGEKELIARTNPALQKYYAAFGSRIGYRLFLGGTRHFGYYEPGSKWPFPIDNALRKMEDRLFHSLNLPPGARVLDAGCGVGHVAIRMASKGLNVVGIDVVSNHVQWAKHNVQSHGFEAAITLHLMDYHHLNSLADDSFDGVYTMETLVHASEPERALEEFFRVIKPGGVITLHEYDHPDFKKYPKDLLESLKQIDKIASMPLEGMAFQGSLPRMLKEQGFFDVQVEDLSANIEPLLHLFFLVGYVPYFFIRLLGLQAWFINIQAGVQGYRLLKRRLGRYIVVKASKPVNQISSSLQASLE